MKTVFIHGAGSTAAVWHYQERHFAGCDAVTLPGHPAGKACKSVDEYREWLREYIIDAKLGKTVLAGASMGGGIALSYTLAYPNDVAGLVLIGTGARLRVNPGFLQLLKDNIGKPPSWYRDVALPMYEGVEPSVRDAVMDRQCKIPVCVHLNDFLCCDQFDIMERIAEIRVPSLIICGDKDIMTPEKYSRYLADRIPGSRLAIIRGAGHLVFLQKPEEVNAEIEAFLNIILKSY